uniref:UDP-3-O-acyl-N-acetylglucosamine deacetylase n=1 Tax=Micromonas pusilla TaxID=38833 RepID=A0A7S0IE45_MICPS|mmetsp:Transcript_3541/g.14481  ORF Transcript_3541/g.14481 Transcript_3541/m.14481 type:complete len:516 (+) Transcript_3541:65-1612(+)
MIKSTSAAMLATTPAAVGGARLASRNAAAPLRAAASKGNPIFALTPRGRARGATTRAAAGKTRSGKTLPGNAEDERPFFDSKEAYDVSGYKNFKSRQELRDAALLDRHWYPTNPESRTYQQTVRRSFTLISVGLHSGEWETVRVCPARAGEGRYFVRVPPGTIPETAADDVEGGAFAREGLTEEETEDMLYEQLRSMLNGEDDDAAERAAELRAKQESAAESPGDFGSSDSGEVRIPAAAALAQDNLRLSMRLAVDDDNGVITCEHLLSALEAIGVDNARIELDGSGEVPIMDGSAYQFAYECARVGLVPAHADGSTAEVPRMAWRPSEMITVRDGDAFVQFIPDAVTKLTYGVDFTYKSTAIGKQWESWTPTEDGDYVDLIARARTFGTMQDYMAYFRAGYIRGGLEQCALVANGDKFWNPPMILPNENARHKILDLVGDLSLMAEPGMAGVPIGHVLAYKGSHRLHAKFLAALAAAPKEKVPAELWSHGDKAIFQGGAVNTKVPVEPDEYPTG